MRLYKTVLPLFLLILTLTATLGFAYWVSYQTHDAGPLIILVVADSHNGGLKYPLYVDDQGRTQGQRCRDLIGNLSKWQFDAFVVLGDFVDHAWNQTHLELFQQDFYHPYLEQFQQPLYLVQGNHEIEGGDAYNWYHPSGWFTVDMKGVHLSFYGWGNGDWTAPRFSEQNMTWIHEDLSATKLSTIVFFHAPMITDDKAWNGNQNPLNVTQAEILCSYPNVIGFATGHTHKRGLGLISDYFNFSVDRSIFSYNPYAISTGHIRCQSNMSLMELGAIRVYPDKVIIECWDVDSHTIVWQRIFPMNTTVIE